MSKSQSAIVTFYDEGAEMDGHEGAATVEASGRSVECLGAFIPYQHPLKYQSKDAQRYMQRFVEV